MTIRGDDDASSDLERSKQPKPARDLVAAAAEGLERRDSGAGGRYKVTGTVTQSEVPEGFAVAMPLYVHFDKTSYAKLATTVLIGNQTKTVEFEIGLPKRPQKIAINSLHDVLAR